MNEDIETRKDEEQDSFVESNDDQKGAKAVNKQYKSLFQIEYSSSDKSFQSISSKEENDLLEDIPQKESNIDDKCNELTYKLMQDVVKKIDDLALEVKDLKTGNFTLKAHATFKVTGTFICLFRYS